MKVAVIGGGSTGCIAALYAQRLGATVSLYESAQNLGGIMRDTYINEHKFFNNCQYLEKSLSCISEFQLDLGLREFPHRYGSLTKLGNMYTRVVDDFAQPVLDGKGSIASSAFINGNAEQRLNAYGSRASVLLAWASRFGNLKELDWRCLLPMQLSRVFFPDDPKFLEKKNTDPISDELFGVPRHRRQPSVGIETSMIPINGYSSWFDALESTLHRKEVSVYLGSSVKLRMAGGRPELVWRQKQVEYDKIIWACNPTALLFLTSGIRLKTPAVKATQIFGQFSKLKSALPYYWQVFDENSPITRVYVYEIDGQSRFSVEAVGADSQMDWRNEVRRCFEELGLDTNFEIFGILNQKRYVNFSQDEFSLIENYSALLPRINIIPCGWNSYGRQEKLNFVFRNLDSLAK
jgi:hypothetical protein